MFENYDLYKLNNPQDFDTQGDGQYVQNKNLEEIRDFVFGICECVYKTGDIEILEHCLEELCCLVGVDNKLSDPKIEKKDTKRLMNWYLGYQRACLDMINNKGSENE